MKPAHFIKIVLNSFEFGYQTRSQTELHLIEWYKKKRQEHILTGILYGLLIGFISMLIQK